MFAFYYEVIVSAMPSVALLRHFVYLQMHDPTQCFGCISFAIARSGNALMRAGKKVENF